MSICLFKPYTHRHTHKEARSTDSPEETTSKKRGHLNIKKVTEGEKCRERVTNGEQGETLAQL